MKNLNLILIIALFSSNILATSPLGDDEKKCRLDVTNLNAALSMKQQLNNDLLSGIWLKETHHCADANAVTSFQFTPNGLVGVLTQCQETILDYSHQVWHLSTLEGGNTVLILTDVNAQKESVYDVKRHCDGLHLTQLETGEEIELIYNSKQQANQLQATTKTLTGDWKCLMVPENAFAERKNIKTASYEYQLKKDGSIKKILNGRNIKAIVQHGFWQISPDGKYLIMHIQNGQQFQTSIAQISYLAFDELVLGQCLATSNMEEELCGDMESFYFNKQ